MNTIILKDGSTIDLPTIRFISTVFTEGAWYLVIDTVQDTRSVPVTEVEVIK